MSNDDPTEKVSADKPTPPTEPTITTILDRINALDTKLSSRLDSIDNRLNRMDSRMDRIESMVLEVRADSRDLRDQLKEHLPALK
jgi:archaellum component FlaC